MCKYYLACLLLVGLAWGQAASPTPATAGQKPMAPPPASLAPPAPAKDVPPDAAVITIKGLCNTPDKAAPSCVTTITRAEFEKLVDAVQPNMPGRSRRSFADRYGHTLVMAKKAENMGLDKGASYEERMRLARIQILAQELSKALQEQASQVSDKDIQDYYQANLPKFEQVDVDRVYIPKNQTPPDGEKTLTTEEEAKFQQDSEKNMKAEADKLRARAVAGEDFVKLQAEAFEVAGLKTGAPNTEMGKVRRNVLAQNQAQIMDLKPGDISPVIADPNGFFIYKMKAKSTMTLIEAHDEIKASLRSQRMQDSMQAAQQSATVTLDESFFGPEMPARGPMMPSPGGPQPPPPAKQASPGPK
ncbi:MAG TPA: peptidyl-prolyl cis-trans isomerase [Terriglobales bacterium]|nr:peptidyl-prolyl cis-trans isomerase [Terriglobales bacterium]